MEKHKNWLYRSPAVAQQDKSYLAAICLTLMAADDSGWWTASLIMDLTFRSERSEEQRQLLRGQIWKLSAALTVCSRAAFMEKKVSGLFSHSGLWQLKRRGQVSDMELYENEKSVRILMYFIWGFWDSMVWAFFYRQPWLPDLQRLYSGADHSSQGIKMPPTALKSDPSIVSCSE